MATFAWPPGTIIKNLFLFKFPPPPRAESRPTQLCAEIRPLVRDCRRIIESCCVSEINAYEGFLKATLYKGLLRAALCRADVLMRYRRFTKMQATSKTHRSVARRFSISRKPLSEAKRMRVWIGRFCCWEMGEMGGGEWEKFPRIKLTFLEFICDIFVTTTKGNLRKTWEKWYRRRSKRKANSYKRNSSWC